MSELRRAARYYADDKNWKIFPLRPDEKVPLTLHGVKDATTDAAQIEAWWTLWPNANIGFACGGENGIHVIDVDVDTEKGIDGKKTVNDLVAVGYSFPNTIWQKTPRGGMHLFYQSIVKPRNKNSFMHGVDIRSEGYYVLLSPSIHPNGVKYEWEAGMTPWEHGLAEYPDFMRPAIESPQVSSIILPHLVSKPADSEFIARAKAYLETCEPAIQGLGGHDKLLWAASAMVNGLRLSDDEAFDVLRTRTVITSRYLPSVLWCSSNRGTFCVYGY